MATKGLFDDLLPPLSTEEFDALRADIKANGVLHPIFVDENGEVLDGRHRLKIDPNAPRRVIKGLSPAEKEAFVFRCNFVRRNLSPEQKAEARKRMRQTAKSLREEDAKKWTQKRVAETLGVDRTTVSTWFQAPRQTNTQTATNATSHTSCNQNKPKPDARVKVSKEQKRQIAERVIAGESVVSVAADYGISRQAAEKIVKSEGVRITAEKAREAAAEKAKSVDVSELADIRHCSMQELLAGLQGLDAIITDPPYPAEFIPLYRELAKLAKKALKPTGILAVMCGQSYLPQILAEMAAEIPYRWTLAYLTPGAQAPQIWDRKISCFWKPVILFGSSSGSGWIADVIKSDGNDKDHHHWGQSESGMARLIEVLTAPGEFVCDPFLGGGTTAAVSVKLKRLFVGCDSDAEAVKTTHERLAIIGKELCTSR